MLFSFREYMYFAYCVWLCLNLVKGIWLPWSYVNPCLFNFTSFQLSHLCMHLFNFDSSWDTFSNWYYGDIPFDSCNLKALLPSYPSHCSNYLARMLHGVPQLPLLLTMHWKCECVLLFSHPIPSIFCPPTFL